jgi:high-affinity nickel-transport protein
VNLVAILALGFFLGMRHATDADHVVAVTSIVSRQRTLGKAAIIGVLWAFGHSLTILLVGGAIVIFEIVIPPRLGLGMEFGVALMLIVLGASNVRGILRDARGTARTDPAHGTDTEGGRRNGGRGLLRPLVVGVVHGLAGSAAIALVVLGAIRGLAWAVAYLALFGVGTIAGMLLVTMALAVPVAAAAHRSGRLHRALGLVTGLASIAFGAVLVYEIGVLHGFFTTHPEWTPR